MVYLSTTCSSCVHRLVCKYRDDFEVFKEQIENATMKTNDDCQNILVMRLKDSSEKCNANIDISCKSYERDKTYSDMPFRKNPCEGEEIL